MLLSSQQEKYKSGRIRIGFLLEAFLRHPMHQGVVYSQGTWPTAMLCSSAKEVDIKPLFAQWHAELVKKARWELERYSTSLLLHRTNLGLMTNRYLYSLYASGHPIFLMFHV